MTAAGAHDHAREEHIRRLLAEHADRVVPAERLEELRARAAGPRRPWWRRLIPTRKTAAPGWTPGTAEKAVSQKGHTAMSTIIQRHAREVRAGDIITADPDHGGMPVRWRVAARPKVTGSGVAIIDYVDISDEPTPGIAHFDALTDLSVEPVGGAA